MKNKIMKKTRTVDDVSDINMSIKDQEVTSNAFIGTLSTSSDKSKNLMNVKVCQKRRRNLQAVKSLPAIDYKHHSVNSNSHADPSIFDSISTDQAHLFANEKRYLTHSSAIASRSKISSSLQRSRAKIQSQ